MPFDLEALYREAGPYALSKTAYLVGRRDIAEEIVHDVFLKLWNKPLEFPTLKQAYAWIYTACHNAGIDHLRSRRRNALATVVDADALKDPTCVADRVANQEILARIVAGLSDREARIIAYRYIDGLGLDAIAEMMSVSEKTVRRALHSVPARHADLRRLTHASAR